MLEKRVRAVDRFLTEASQGCLMAVLPTADAAPILSWSHEQIQPGDLAGDGFESAPHVTVLYGFNPGVTPVEVQKVLQLWGRSELRFTLGPIFRFDTSPEYDVLNCSVKFDQDLRELNGLLVQQFAGKITQTFPDYRPHLCIAYLRKGACPGLNGHGQWEDSTFVLKSLVFSLPESTSKFSLPLGPAPEQEDGAVEVFVAAG